MNSSKQVLIKKAIIASMILLVILTISLIAKNKARVNSNLEIDINDLKIKDTVSVYIQDESGEYTSSDTIPTEGYSLNIEASYCTVNGEEDTSISLSYDVDTKTLNVSPLTTRGTKCYLYFEESKSATDIIENLYEDNQDILAYDGTTDNNLRYIGADPANYVYFNCDDYTNPSSSTCELWRIIGIFDENTHGISGEKLVKLIRNESLGDIAWDEEYGTNWSTASLQMLLNKDYLNRTGDYSSTGITSETRDMIETVTWKLGGIYSQYNKASTFYTAERGTAVSSGNPTEWEGKIALIYASDYGYATSGGSTGRDTCLSYDLGDWGIYSNCYNNDWLNDVSDQWSISTFDHYTDYNNYVFDIEEPGFVDVTYSDAGIMVRPTVYLTSEVTITGGSGTQTNPYTLSL